MAPRPSISAARGLLLALATAQGLLACGGHANINLALSELSRSFILATSGANGLELQAFDLGEAARLDLDPGGFGPVHVLAYRRTLEELGLSVGPVPLDPAGGPLPTPDGIFELEGDLESATGFVERVTLPPTLAAVRIAATNPCVQFMVQDAYFLPEGPPTQPTFAVPLDEARVLVGLADGRLFTVGENAAEMTSSPLPGRALVTAALGRNGDVWIGAANGAIARGNPDRGFVSAPSVPLLRGEGVELVSSPPTAPFELYAATSSLAVFRFANDAWTEIAPRSGGIFERSRLQPGWLAPGRVALVGGSVDHIIEISEGEPPVSHRLSLPLRPTTDNLHSLDWVEGFGSVSGSRYSSFFHRAPRGWELMPLPTSTPVAHAFVDLGDGTFVAGGESSVLTQWLPTLRQCPQIANTPSGGTIKEAARLGTGFVAIGEKAGEPISITRYLRP